MRGFVMNVFKNALCGMMTSILNQRIVDFLLLCKTSRIMEERGQIRLKGECTDSWVVGLFWTQRAREQRNKKRGERGGEETH